MLLTLNETAQITSLSRRSLERLEKRGLVPFTRIDGRVFVDLDDLCKAPILTRGKAARLVGRSWRTAKRWADAGILTLYHEPFPNSKGRTSIDAIYLAKKQVNRGSK